MNRFWEIILGLQKGFLDREGEFRLSFTPQWPGQETLGASSWNFLLAALAIGAVIYIYRHEGRSRSVRITLGIIRGLLLALLITLLNRPILTLGQTRSEPSVLAVMIDDSISMRIRDASAGANAHSPRLAAVVDVLSGENRKLLADLGKIHQLKFYRFDSDALPLDVVNSADPSSETDRALKALQPTGQTTQLLRSVRTVLNDLQGQRLAGVVILTDGRETPAQQTGSALATIKEFGVKLYPIAVGSDKAPTNVEVQSVVTQESAFKGDIVNVKATIRGSGFAAGQSVAVRLKDKKTGLPLRALDGGPLMQRVIFNDDSPQEVELQFKPTDVGLLDVLVEAEKQADEIDEDDNSRTVQVAVLDAKINVLYVDGYPRWEYRYIKNELIRDHSVNVSCLLTSADPTFRQEGDPPDDSVNFPGPLTRFPESIEELAPYDVVIFGDVDPRQFSDSQLQAVAEFVSKRGGGFGMVAGPQYSPSNYRGTPIEALLPVTITRSLSEDAHGEIQQGFRPVLTREGANSSLFRFLADKTANDKFLKDEIPPIFWFSRGITTKPGVGEVYAEHPTEIAPDGRKAPLLVFGRFGSGRTLFSAIDDSWRWRFYTGESIFDTYWIQQVRQLARSRKLGQRKLQLVADKSTYDLGEQVRLNLRVLDPQLLTQLPEQIRVGIVEEQADDASATTNPTTRSASTQPGTLVRQENLLRQEGQPDLFTLSFMADRAGRFVVQLPAIAGGVANLDLPFAVNVPRLELAQPEVDRVSLSRLASETQGQVVAFEQARQTLPSLIASAAKIIPVETVEPLWDAPIAMVLFVLLITAEWVARKLNGMI